MKHGASSGSAPGWALVLAPIVFLLFWSAGYPFAKIILQYSEPLTALATRYIIVLLVMVPIFAFRALGDVIGLQTLGRLYFERRRTP